MLCIVTLLLLATETRCNALEYARVNAGLFHVPNDIPDGTTRVDLEQNSIARLRSGTFSHLGDCTSMTLMYNSIAIIDDIAFSGMGELE